MSGKLANRYCVVGLVSVAAVLVGLVLVAPVAAVGVDILNTNGFESPTYRTGDLVNQNNWERFGSASTATVQTTVKASGLQAVEVTRAANDDCRWLVASTGGYPSSSNRYIDISWAMNVLHTDLPGAGTYGPFFGVEAYQDTDTNPGAKAKLFGSLGVDAKTGDVLYQTTGQGSLTETGRTVTFGAWNDFLIRLDFADMKYTTYLNGAALVTEAFVDSGLTTFTDADISALAAMDGAISQGATGTAYYDNFRVQEVPEPSTIVLCLTALAALAGFAWRRR